MDDPIVRTVQDRHRDAVQEFYRLDIVRSRLMDRLQRTLDQAERTIEGVRLLPGREGSRPAGDGLAPAPLD